MGCCRTCCKYIRCILQLVNTLFLILGLSLAITGGLYAYALTAIPGPVATVATTMVGAGIVITIVSIVGFRGAELRKLEGEECKGKVLLIIYVAVVGSMVILLASLAVVLFVWLDGNVEDYKTGSRAVDSRLSTALDKADAPVDNFVRCTFDSCCYSVVSAQNTTRYEPCWVDENGAPSTASEATLTFVDGHPPHEQTITATSSTCQHFPGFFSNQTCSEGIGTFGGRVKHMLREHVLPVAGLLTGSAVLMVIGLVCAVLEFFWCFGKSEVFPEENLDFGDDGDDDYDDYDDVYRS